MSATLVLTILACGPTWSVQQALSAPSKPPPQFPVQVYEGNRVFSEWIASDAGRVPVDEGIEWAGQEIYLTPPHLVVRDKGETRARWVQPVGSWRVLSIAEVPGEDGPRIAVTLRTAPDADPVVFYDLQTGEQIGSAKAPSGAVTKDAVWDLGHATTLAEGTGVVARSADAWTRLRSRLSISGESPLPPDLLGGDAAYTILAYADTARPNTKGLRFEALYEDDQRILVRFRHQSFQSLEIADTIDWTKVTEPRSVRPWGAVVVPSRTDKRYVVEIDRRTYTRAPPRWEEVWRSEASNAPASESSSSRLPSE